jgi:hypothetical protein
MKLSIMFSMISAVIPRTLSFTVSSPSRFALARAADATRLTSGKMFMSSETNINTGKVKW